MRIALCLSGLPRCYDYHPESLLQLFEPHQVDVFAHHWSDALDEQQKKKIQDIWGHRAVMFEPQPYALFADWTQRTYHLRTAGRAHGNTFPMWYSIYHANELKRQWEQQQGWTYDAVCRARTDLWANGRWTAALDRIRPNQVILSHERHYDGGYNDTIALGDSASMDRYSAVWTWFPKALENGCVFGYEVMLRQYIDQWSGLTVAQVPIQSKVMRPGDRHKTYDQVDWNARPSPPNHQLI